MHTVSVIIPCYNAGAWLQEAIESCFNQTYGPIEIIVVDDGSEDDSLSIARSYGDGVRVLTGPRRGISSARNRGFEGSSGKFIQFLDADDYLLPEKIERDVRFLEHERADAVYGDWRIQQHHPSGLFTLGEVY